MSLAALFGGSDSTANALATGTSITVNKPANVAVGDTLFVYFYGQFAGTPGGLSGWTAAKTLGSRAGGCYYISVTNSTVLSGLPSSWTFTDSGSGRLCGIIWRVTGADLTNPIDAVGTEVTQGSTSPLVVPAVTAGVPNALLMVLTYWNNSSATTSTVSPDAALTDGQQTSSPTTGNTSGIDIAYQQLTSTGSTGTRSNTVSPNDASHSAFMFTIKPAAGSATADTSLSAAASLSAVATNSTTAAGSLATTTTLTADTNRGVSTASTLTATATLSAAATVTTGASAAASLVTTAALTASAVVATIAQASLAVTAGLSAATIRGVSAGASLGITAALSSMVQTPAQQWATTIPLCAGHHGESADRPESTMYGYDGAAAWNKAMALEVSVWQSSDGVWFVSHDQNTGTTQAIGGGNQWNASYDIPTTAATTLDTVSTITGSYPFMRLSTLLAKYGGQRVLIIDNKGSQDVAGLISILNAAGGPAWYISKSFYTSVAWAGGMRTAGYLTLGYFYDATPQSDIMLNQGKFDVLMEEYNASSSNWSYILALPQPVMAHIVANTSQKATAIANGAEGFMASGVQEVVPPTGVQATLASTATVTASATRATSASATLTVAAALSASAVVAAQTPAGSRWQTASGANQFTGSPGSTYAGKSGTNQLAGSI